MRGGLNHTESNTNTKQRKNLWKINDNDRDEQDTQRVALLCLSLAQGEKNAWKVITENFYWSFTEKLQLVS